MPVIRSETQNKLFLLRPVVTTIFKIIKKHVKASRFCCTGFAFC